MMEPNYSNRTARPFSALADARQMTDTLPLILLLLASMLIRIPFGLVKAGIELMRAMIPERAKNAP